MRYYAVPFMVSALAYLALGLWVLARQETKVQKLYGFVCLATSLWQAMWVALFSAPTAPWLGVAARICFTGVVLIPAVFYHFIQQFTGEHNQNHILRWLYGISGALAMLVWLDGWFIQGFNGYSWGVAAKAGPLYAFLALLVAGVIVRTLVLLKRMDRNPEATEPQKRQTALVKLATCAYLGGAIDLVSQFGVPLFPLSFLFTGAASVLFGYAIFKYEFLKMASTPESAELRVRRQAASAEMKRLNMVAAFPLVSQGELLGYLLLGEKMSEEAYSKEDLLLLRIVANQAALAYQRVRYLEMAVHGARTEMLGEIAGGFAHEIKTPLANISLPAELSMMDLHDVEKGRKRFEDILPELKARLSDIMQQTMKASEKIEAIRQFSKPGQIALQPVDLHEVLMNSLRLLEHLLHRTNTRVCVDFPASLPTVRGDAKQLEIVFVNLIKNAAEAMSLHSSPGLARELNIHASEDSQWAVVSVKDSGPGIRKTDFSHLFEAYFTTKGSTGTGMGLFLSRQVIKAHGGSIDVKSEEGKGTEFVIRLPKYMSQEHTGVHQAA